MGPYSVAYLLGAVAVELLFQCLEHLLLLRLGDPRPLPRILGFYVSAAHLLGRLTQLFLLARYIRGAPFHELCLLFYLAPLLRNLLFIPDMFSPDLILFQEFVPCQQRAPFHLNSYYSRIRHRLWYELVLVGNRPITSTARGRSGTALRGTLRTRWW